MNWILLYLLGQQLIPAVRPFAADSATTKHELVGWTYFLVVAVADPPDPDSKDVLKFNLESALKPEIDRVGRSSDQTVLFKAEQVDVRKDALVQCQRQNNCDVVVVTQGPNKYDMVHFSIEVVTTNPPPRDVPSSAPSVPCGFPAELDKNWHDCITADYILDIAYRICEHHRARKHRPQPTAPEQCRKK